jgi:hypothetical protein
VKKEDEHLKSGDVVWHRLQKRYLKLDKGAGKTQTGLQFWDCSTMDKKNEENDLKHLDEADFQFYVTLWISVVLTNP